MKYPTNAKPKVCYTFYDNDFDWSDFEKWDNPEEAKKAAIEFLKLEKEFEHELNRPIQECVNVVKMIFDEENESYDYDIDFDIQVELEA